MNREQYLNTLKSYLTECSAQEAQELLDDVKQHFAEAAEFGLTEEEVCQRLGDPRELAKAYLEEVPVHAQATASLGTQRGEYSGVHQLTVETGHCSVELYQSETENTVVDINDPASGEENQIEVVFDMGHLKIRQRSARARFLFFLDNRIPAKARVWLGKDFAGDVRLSTASGDLYAAGVSANNLVLGTGSGKAHGENLGANNMSVKCGSGGILLDSLRVAQRLTAVSGSGGLRLSRISAAEASASTGSGGITLEELDIALRLSANSGSGTVKVQNTAAQEFSCKVGSGSIKVAESTCPRLSLVTASGSIKAECSCAEASLTSTSGSITLDSAQLCNVTATTVSGSVRMNLPPEQEMTINTTVVASGHVDIGFPASTSGGGNKRQFVVGSGAYNVNLRSVSGSISVAPRA